MQFYIKDDNKEVRFLYYNVTDQEFEYIVNHQYKLFPIRFFTKKYFCPYLNKEHAERSAAEVNNWHADVHTVHILRFLISATDLQHYVKGSLDNDKTIVTVYKNELQKFNSQIVGYIECIETLNLRDPTNEFIFQ